MLNARRCAMERIKAVRRVQFFGAPGTGKSVLAHEALTYFKKAGMNCEIVLELAREWAYINRGIQSMDQIYLFASQMTREDSLLSREKVDFVITDSPLLLNCWYSRNQNPVFWESLRPLVQLFDQRFQPINFFCPINKSYKFHQEGRHFPEEESISISHSMRDLVEDFYGKDNVIVLPNENRLQAVVEALKERGRAAI